MKAQTSDSAARLSEFESSEIANQYEATVIQIIAKADQSLSAAANNLLEYKQSLEGKDRLHSAPLHVGLAVKRLIDNAERDIVDGDFASGLTREQNVERLMATLANGEWSLHALFPDGPAQNPFLTHWADVCSRWLGQGHNNEARSKQLSKDPELLKILELRIAIIYSILRDNQNVGVSKSGDLLLQLDEIPDSRVSESINASSIIDALARMAVANYEKIYDDEAESVGSRDSASRSSSDQPNSSFSSTTSAGWDGKIIQSPSAVQEQTQKTSNVVFENREHAVNLLLVEAAERGLSENGRSHLFQLSGELFRSSGIHTLEFFNAANLQPGLSGLIENDALTAKAMLFALIQEGSRLDDAGFLNEIQDAILLQTMTPTLLDLIIELVLQFRDTFGSKILRPVIAEAIYALDTREYGSRQQQRMKVRNNSKTDHVQMLCTFILRLYENNLFALSQFLYELQGLQQYRYVERAKQVLNLLDQELKENDKYTPNERDSMNFRQTRFEGRA